MNHPTLVNGILRIRPYDAADAAVTLRVFRGAVRRSAARDYTVAQIAAWAPKLTDLSAWAERRSSRRTWVAERDGSVIGFGELEPDGHVDMLYVDPHHEGQGVASALLDEIERTAREDGLVRLHAEVSLTARAVFIHRGFDMITRQVAELRGESLVNYKMEKRLDPLAGHA